MRVRLLLQGFALTLVLAQPAGAMDDETLLQVRAARSIAAEAAAICDQQTRGAITGTYANEMLRDAADELRDARRKAVSHAPQLIGVISLALRGAEAGDGRALHRASETLFAMEGAHGRAD
jgi:hypothetical protein